MFAPKSAIRLLGSIVAITGCLLAAAPTITFAQSNPGFTLIGGAGKDTLDYYLDFGGQRDNWDRYRLRIPAKKMDLGADKFTINYPDYYEGTFDKDQVEVVVQDQTIKPKEVTWDQENHRLQIFLEKTIESGKDIEIVLSNVKNPSFGGIFNFNCMAENYTDSVPLPRYVGTWVLSIS